MRVIDLNADLGELPGVEGASIDASLLSIVSSANVACGGHAGDAESMLRVCRAAVAASVAIGAQVSYVDREGFGRTRLPVPDTLLRAQLREQVEELSIAADAAGGLVRYLKPHGALYHAAAQDPAIADVVVEVADTFGLPVLTLPQGHLRARAEAAGLAVHGEAFADRAYAADGSLVPRDVPTAVVSDHAVVVARVTDWALTGRFRSVDGRDVIVDAVSLCLHGDTPGAVELARSTRAALESAAVTIAPFAGFAGSA